MDRVGFLSFGHWQPIPGSQTRTASEALVQTIELAVAAEEIGIDGAFVRVHHFARQLSSPFPLLAAMAARTSRIEIGTAVIDMRYENPLYMAEEAAATHRPPARRGSPSRSAARTTSRSRRPRRTSRSRRARARRRRARGELLGEVVDAEVGAVGAERLDRLRELDRLDERVGA